MPDNLYDVLQARGFIAQCTSEQLRERLFAPTVAYCGFDPTADSLHVGSLIPIMGLAHLQRCGHKPLVLVGGATALIGDPSGKTEARKMLTRAEVDANARAIAAQVGRLVHFDNSATGALLVNNADWLGRLNWIELLREIGPHFSVNRMLTMDSVKGRLEHGGITFLEFNYMIMQAYDFLHLHRSAGCSLQLGGQDQWGNIVMGIELGRRSVGAELFGLTLPLVTRADGGKFGKSEKSNIWLSAERTAPYDFYQFWRNCDDGDVQRFLGYFTFLAMNDIEQLTSQGGEALNYAKEVLAFEVTTLVHGNAEAELARDSARKAFGVHHDVTGDAIPHGVLPVADLETGVSVVSLLVRAGLAPSNGDAKRLIQGGGVSIHDQRVDDLTRKVTTADMQQSFVLLRVGKKKLYRFDVVE